MSDANDSESQRVVYQELYNSYRAIDTFRTALLGLLPVASGTAIFLLYNDVKGGNDAEGIADDTLEFLGPIGLFGFFITLGLFLFEIYGTRKCHDLIEAGKDIEERLRVPGQFKSRKKRVLGVINEPFAAGVIYPAVLAAWAFVAVYAFSDRSDVASWGAAGIVFTGGFALSLINDHRLEADAKDKEKDRLLEQARREVIEHTSLKEVELRDAEQLLAVADRRALILKGVGEASHLGRRLEEEEMTIGGVGKMIREDFLRMALKDAALNPQTAIRNQAEEVRSRAEEVMRTLDALHSH